MKARISVNTPGLLEDILARLITPRPDCRLWMGATSRGYGRLEVDGRTVSAHRLVWELTYGPIPDDLTVDHLCRIRTCLNVEHMELVTHSENVKRATPYRVPPIGGYPLKSHCLRGHAMTPENVYFKPDGRRECIACNRAREAKRTERRRAKAKPKVRAS